MEQRRPPAPPPDHAAPPEPATPPSVAVPVSTRERILDVALDLFIRKGYTETSLREIAAELGISKAALYYHFASKQDIFGALHMRFHALTDGILPLLQAQAQPGDIWERLVDHLIGLVLQNRRLIELHLRNREVMEEMHHGAAHDNHSPAPQADLQSHMHALLRDPSVSLEVRVRRIAALGAIAGVVIASQDLGGVEDAEIERAMRGVVRDLLEGH